MAARGLLVLLKLGGEQPNLDIIGRKAHGFPTSEASFLPSSTMMFQQGEVEPHLRKVRREGERTPQILLGADELASAQPPSPAPVERACEDPFELGKTSCEKHIEDGDRPIRVVEDEFGVGEKDERFDPLRLEREHGAGERFSAIGPA